MQRVPDDTEFLRTNTIVYCRRPRPTYPLIAHRTQPVRWLRIDNFCLYEQTIVIVYMRLVGVRVEMIEESVVICVFEISHKWLDFEVCE